MATIRIACTTTLLTTILCTIFLNTERTSSSAPSATNHDCLHLKNNFIYNCNDSSLFTYDKTYYYRPETLILENIRDSSWRDFINSNISFDVTESLYIVDSPLEFFEFLVTNISLASVKLLRYSNNLKTKLECRENFHQILEKLVVQAPKLKNLQLLNVGACRLRDFSNFSELIVLDLSNNEHNLPKLPVKLESLNVSYNSISSIANFAEFNSGNGLRHLNFSNNYLTSLNDHLTSDFPRLENLIVSYNPLKILPSAFGANKYLQFIEMDSSSMENLNLETFRNLADLKILSLMNSHFLRYIYGGKVVDTLKSIDTLNFRNSSLNYLDYDVFENLPEHVKVDLSLNNFTCDCRSLALVNLLSSNYLNLNQTFCSKSTKIFDFLTNSNFSASNCSLGYGAENGAIVRSVYGADKILDCQIFGQSTPSVKWFKFEEGKFVDIPANHSQDESKFVAYPDGTLKIKKVDRADVGIYACRLKNQHGNFTVYQRFRLDYAYLWWLMKIYSILCGIFVAMASFALNVISGAIRRLVIWRVSKLERTGRVRMLLESMEKYRSRQMVNLHEMYASNVNQIRENYRQQLETLRRSYTSQAGRFRDYRATQMENVASHLDALRDNYNMQVHRIRDYGSKHMERVYNVYQRRVTGLRNYTLQQRLRLMRQYKLKQRYINRILENLNLHGSGGVTNIDNDGRATNESFESTPNDHNRSKFDIEMQFIKAPPILPLDDLILSGKHFSSQIFDPAMLDNEDESLIATTSTNINNTKMRRCSSDSFLMKICQPQDLQMMMKKLSLKRESDKMTSGENSVQKKDEDRASFHTIMSEDFQFKDKAAI